MEIFGNRLQDSEANCDMPLFVEACVINLGGPHSTKNGSYKLFRHSLRIQARLRTRSSSSFLLLLALENMLKIATLKVFSF